MKIIVIVKKSRVKNLGLHFDKNMKWKTQSKDMLANKCPYLLNQLSMNLRNLKPEKKMKNDILNNLLQEINNA